MFDQAQLKRKAAFMLMEVCIALSLAAIILGFFLQLLISSEKHRKLAAHALKNAHQHLIVDLSLTRLFNQRCQCNEESHAHCAQKPFCLSHDYPDSHSPALFLISDQGLDFTPEFTGCQQVICFIDKQGRLCLRTETLQKGMRTDVLLEGVTTLEWSFFDRAQKQWVSTWPEKKKAYSALLKLRLRLKQPAGQVLEYGFILSQDKVVEVSC